METFPEFSIFTNVGSIFDDIEHKILSPLACLKKYDNHWNIECDLPLVNKKDIKIAFDDNTVIIEAKLREEYSERKGDKVTKFEYFKKSISLPGKINKKKMTARFYNGRLTVNIPKSMNGDSIQIN